MLVSSSNDDIKQHVSNHFLEDCKIGTSPEMMYSVDAYGFRKSAIMSGLLRGARMYIASRGAQKQSVPPF